MLRRAVELGVNFIDTAESYGPQTDEILIAEALHPYPKGFVIATKCGLARPRASRWDADGRPEKLRRDLEGSLKRLRLERIDLYQLHTVDPKVPLEESVGTLADMQREGKVRHIGAFQRDRAAARAPRAGSCRSSRCRTATAWPTAARRTCSCTARSTASPSCRGIRWATVGALRS